MQRPVPVSMDNDDGLNTFDSPGCDDIVNKQPHRIMKNLNIEGGIQ